MRLLYLFALFLTAKKGKPQLKAWREFRKVCMQKLKDIPDGPITSA